MKLDPKWLLPPAAALCLVLGPLAMNSTGAPAPAAGSESAPGSGAVKLPRTPDASQVLVTLVGLLALGGAALWFAQRARPAAGGGSGLALRQSLRLAARQSIHLVEFDGRLLLIGSGEQGVTLLDRVPSPEAEVEEDASEREPIEEGAVPRDLVIPRPASGARRAAPTPPGRKRHPGLSDFRALLQKAGKA
ncbi:MAG: hypothetical protein Fur0037_29230 [Planctomycetota bacterium]